MARQNSGGRPAPRAAPRRALDRNSPQSARRVPPPAPAQGGNGGPLLGAIGAIIAEGMAFGTGSAIAHRAVEAVLGGPQIIRHETVVSQAAAARPPSTNSADSCVGHSKAFQECLDSNGSDMKCQFYLEMLTECKKKFGYVMGA